ncbi:MAG: glycosyltransferase family 39 protein [Desulfuromonadaceae bacterium]|nr:glycosyltransferase family 39 protein [Desulfuromonadaceae bacterium]
MKLKVNYFCLFLIFISLVVYYPTMFAPLNSLDDYLFVEQLLNRDTFSLKSHFAPGGTYDYYRPLLTLTFELDKYIGGLEESFMHLVNILLHTLNVILVFLLARRFTRFVGREGDLLPFLAAVLFCLHPINTEAVNWIAGRTDLLAATFVLVFLILFFKALDCQSIVWGGISATALFCGFLCKETALFILPGIFLLMFWRPQSPHKTWHARWMIIGFCLAAVAVYFTLRWGAYTTDRGIGNTAKLVAQVAASVRPDFSSVTASTPNFPFLEAIRVILKVSGYYAAKLFQPLPLNFAIDRVGSWYILPGLILVILLIFQVIRRRPVGVFFLMSAFLGSSALFVVFTRLAWTPIAERYMYIPCSFFSIAVIFGAADMIDRMNLQKMVPPFVTFLFASSAWATVNRNIVWQDNLTLYQDTVLKSPNFSPAKNELAIALYAHGRTKEADEIIACISEVSNQRSSLNQAAIMWKNKEYEGARRILIQRLQSPGDLEINILEMLVKITGEMADKESNYSSKRTLYTQMLDWLELIEKRTHNPFYWYRLGRVHLMLNNRAEAQRCFNLAAINLPKNSIYSVPAARLAKNLSKK